MTIDNIYDMIIWQYIMTIYDNIWQFMTIYDNIWQWYDMPIYDNIIIKLLLNAPMLIE